MMVFVEGFGFGAGFTGFVGFVAGFTGFGAGFTGFFAGFSGLLTSSTAICGFLYRQHDGSLALQPYDSITFVGFFCSLTSYFSTDFFACD